MELRGAGPELRAESAAGDTMPEDLGETFCFLKTRGGGR